MDCMNLKYFLGTNESAYSKAIAQSFVLSKSFRNKLLELINSKHNNTEIENISNGDVTDVVLEKCFNGNSDRIDIYFEMETDLLIGIENKKWAGLQKDQLKRYKDALENENRKYILVLLAPEKYVIESVFKPENFKNGVFIEINYTEIDVICKQILKEDKDVMTQSYILSLSNFIGDLTMQPFKTEEVSSLMYYNNAEGKIIQILNDLKDANISVEKSRNFILAPKSINCFSSYFGFRFGTDWYFKEPLLNSQPELIFYVKDTEVDFDKAIVTNNKIKKISEKFKNDLEAKYQCKVDYYGRKKANECRLAIRKSFSDFDNQPVIEIYNWFRAIIAYAEQNLL